jgi:hypothetical protein
MCQTIVPYVPMCFNYIKTICVTFSLVRCYYFNCMYDLRIVQRKSRSFDVPYSLLITHHSLYFLLLIHCVSDLRIASSDQRSAHGIHSTQNQLKLCVYLFMLAASCLQLAA